MFKIRVPTPGAVKLSDSLAFPPDRLKTQFEVLVS